MTIKDRISKRSAELILKELKEKGIVNVADPEKIAKKIKKYTGVDVIICKAMIKLCLY